MKLIARGFDIGISEVVALLDPKDAAELGVKDNDRLLVEGKNSIVAILAISDTLVKAGEVILLGKCMAEADAKDGDIVKVTYSPVPQSVRGIRRKMDGQKLEEKEIQAIVNDILENRLSNIEVSAWITSLYIRGMDIEEIAWFTNAMVDTGKRIKFSRAPVYDFHSMGGVPGNKITPIVVSIVAAAGQMLPKTSSRAISSACGTSDFVETFCNVEMTAERLKEISEEIGGVFAWGGSMNIAPVDDIVIKVEHPLGINPRAQMLASIMSKKMAIGATHLLVDIPMGSGTKVPSIDIAKAYARDFMDLGERLGIHVECAITYADQPVGNAIGPNLEARECIRILEGAEHPASVVEKACEMAGIILEMGGNVNGKDMARDILRSGRALNKFKEIVVAQGGNKDIISDDLQPGKFSVDVKSVKSGYIHAISNKDIVAIAKAAGAPGDKGAGLMIYMKKGQRVEQGDTIMTIYADNDAKLNRAKDLAVKYSPVDIEGMLLRRVSDPKVM